MEAWVGIITQGGAVAVLAAWVWVLRQSWLDERDERRAMQKERDALLERVLKALYDSETAIKAGTAANQSTQLVVSGMKDLMVAEAGRHD